MLVLGCCSGVCSPWLCGGLHSAGAVRTVSQGSDPALRTARPASQRSAGQQHQRIHTTYTTQTQTLLLHPQPRSTHLPTILGCLQPRTISSTGAASEMCKFPCQQRMRRPSLGQMDGSTTSTLHRPGEGKYNPQCM